MVRACVIRDGTQGISLYRGETVIGEWTDNRVTRLLLTDDLKVAICGAGGNRIYLFSVPGKTISGEQLSETEVVITFEMDTKEMWMDEITLGLGKRNGR